MGVGGQNHAPAAVPPRKKVHSELGGGPEIWVGIATRYGLDSPGIES
jgi:hypothetical protein